MTKNLKFKIILILAIILASLYYLYPSFYLSRLSPEKRRTMALSDPQALRELEEKSIKLGLDLQGGMHLVLELDENQVPMGEEERKDAIDRALEIIRTRVDQFGVSEPLIQKAGEDRIIVELAGVVDTSRARGLVQQSAYLEFKLVKPSEEFRQVLQLVDEVIRDNDLVLLQDHELPSAAAPGTQGRPEGFDPLDLFKESGPQDTAAAGADTAGADTAAVDTAALDTAAQAGAIPGAAGAPSAELAQTPFSRLFFQEPPMAQSERRQAELLVPVNNVPLLKAYLELPQVRETIAGAEANGQVDFTLYRSPLEDDEPDSLEVLWGDDATDLVTQDGTEYKRIYLLKKLPEMTGQLLADAQATIGSGYDPQVANKPLVLMDLTSEGADSFLTITERYLQRDLAIVLDKIVKFSPRIMSRIPGGRARIEGVPDMDKARDLAIVLRAGALPAPLTIAESRSVGPSLGADSIRSGSISGLIGLGLVMLIMLVYYRFGGVVANIALLLDVIIILAALAGFSATLTLPGIAGLILTIGMAVDANVLIFERIREELRTGKSLRAAVDAGYDRAFSAILDSNVTTFITAVVLFQFGTGPIKGFAVTLSIGLAASMFTAIYVTRVIFDLWTRRKGVQKIAI